MQHPVCSQQRIWSLQEVKLSQWYCCSLFLCVNGYFVNCFGFFFAAFILRNTSVGGSCFSTTWAGQKSTPPFTDLLERCVNVHVQHLFLCVRLVGIEVFLVLGSFIFCWICRKMVQLLAWAMLRWLESTYCRCPPCRWPSSCSSITEKSTPLRWAPSQNFLYRRGVAQKRATDAVISCYMWHFCPCPNRKSIRRPTSPRGIWHECWNLCSGEKRNRRFWQRSPAPRSWTEGTLFQSMTSSIANCTKLNWKQVSKGAIYQCSQVDHPLKVLSLHPSVC